MNKLNKLENIEINEKDGYAFFSINPLIYSLDVIHAAAYVMLNRAFIILDGDPMKEVKVEIRKKEDKHELLDLVISFNEELLNYATYKVQAEKNNNLRKILLQKVLLNNNPNYFMQNKKQDENKPSNYPNDEDNISSVKKSKNYQKKKIKID